MKTSSQFESIYIWREFIDFRKSINGLSALVQEQMQLDPFSSSLYIFSCRQRRKLKIIYWDKTGFALWYKKLQEDRFPWPNKSSESIIHISSKQLDWILDGIDLWKIKPHEEKKYSKVC